jgi:hypothetical protein
MCKYVLFSVFKGVFAKFIGVNLKITKLECFSKEEQ